MAKWNYVEMTGDLVEDPREKENVTFIDIALWKNRSKNGGIPNPTYVSIACFDSAIDKLKELKLKNGEAVEIRGILNSYKNAEGHIELRIKTQFAKNIERYVKKELKSETSFAYD